MKKLFRWIYTNEETLMGLSGVGYILEAILLTIIVQRGANMPNMVFYLILVLTILVTLYLLGLIVYIVIHLTKTIRYKSKNGVDFNTAWEEIKTML